VERVDEKVAKVQDRERFDDGREEREWRGPGDVAQGDVTPGAWFAAFVN